MVNVSIPLGAQNFVFRFENESDFDFEKGLGQDLALGTVSNPTTRIGEEFVVDEGGTNFATFTEYLVNMGPFPSAVTYSFRPQIDMGVAGDDTETCYGDVFNVVVNLNPIGSASAAVNGPSTVCVGETVSLTGEPTSTFYHPSPFTHAWSLASATELMNDDDIDPDDYNQAGTFDPSSADQQTVTFTTPSTIGNVSGNTNDLIRLK